MRKLTGCWRGAHLKRTAVVTGRTPGSSSPRVAEYLGENSAGELGARPSPETMSQLGRDPMGKAEGGGTVGKLWRRHGGGYYALLAIGTFVYLEITSLTSSIGAAETVKAFMVSELFTFAIESIVNTVMASMWPFMWYSWMGTEALYWVGGGYAIWAVFIAMALNRREERMRRDLDL